MERPESETWQRMYTNQSNSVCHMQKQGRTESETVSLAAKGHALVTDIM
jgi:hypothetical protein